MSENRQDIPRVIRFGPFDADLQTQELRKHGVRIRLPGQSFQILKMLLERPGDLVTREELQGALWSADTFVDFDRGLSAAVNRLRDALGDSADDPRYVETLPRRGYRFIGSIAAPITPSEPASETSAAPTPAPPPSPAGPHPIAASRWTPSRIAALLLTGAVCIALGTFAYLRWRHRSSSPSITAVQFTALKGWSDYPAFSPDGSRIAFVWNGGDELGSEVSQLYVKTIGSEKLMRLTNKPSLVDFPAWSPDGTQIAFHRLSKDGSGIYMIPAQGGPEKLLRATHASFGNSMSISWSPDGKFIAFADSPASGGHKRLFLLSLETLKSTQIEHNEKCQDESSPHFSHDGKQLLYACIPDSKDFAIFLANSSGAEPKLLRESSGWLHGLAWMGDNKTLIFLDSSTGGRDGLHELTIADGSIRDLPFPPEAGSLIVSPKSHRLAFTIAGSGKNTIWRADLLHPQTPPVDLIPSSRSQEQPQYSPDGKHIVFDSDRGGPREIWMSDPDGSNIVQLTNLKAGSGSPYWSPDSRKIVFDFRTAVGPTQDHADLYIVDIAERVPRKLMTGTDEASVPSWSHDGKWIFFAGGGDDAAGEKIYRVPPEGGHAEVLSSLRGVSALESFDGQSLYFAVPGSPNTLLRTASLNPTGTESSVEGMPLLSSTLNWTVVRDGVYFFPADDFKTLSYFDFAAKQVHPLFTTGPVFYGVSVSPDGRYVLYAQLNNHSDIMLVNDFR